MSGSAQAERPPDAKPCGQHRVVTHRHTAVQHRQYAHKVWAPKRWERGTPVASRKQRARLRHMRVCARPGARRRMEREQRQTRKAFFVHRREQRRERRIQALTPYCGYQGRCWAIPGYIVACESGGNFRVYNGGYEPGGPGSGPGGAYQIIRSTWQGYGGYGVAHQASEEEQHAIAGRIWAAEGSSPWACA